MHPRGGTLKFSVYIGEADFFGVKILNFRIFLGFGVEAGASPMYPQKMRVTPPPPPPGRCMRGSRKFSRGGWARRGGGVQIPRRGLTKKFQHGKN